VVILMKRLKKNAGPNSTDIMIPDLAVIPEVKVSIVQIAIPDPEAIPNATTKRLRKIERKRKPNPKALLPLEANPEIK